MAIDFPSAGLVVGQLFTAPTNGVTYRWDGTLWLTQAGPGGGTGDFCANQTSSFPTIAATDTTLILTQVYSGNSGSWYSTSTGRYTPPAGRYAISAGFTAFGAASQSFTVSLRKNGTTLQSSVDTGGGTNQWANPTAMLIVDANGIDWFDMQGSSNAGGGGTAAAMYFQAFPLTGMQGPAGAPATGYLLSNATATITAGYTYTPFSIGTVSSGTTTLAGANGNYQYLTNNGAFTLAAPAADTAISLLVTNGASAGAITFSGFTVGSATGDALTTTNTSKFLLSIVRINATSTYLIKALQ